MKKYLLVITVLIVSLVTNAQQFINAGMIEYEMKTNNHKTFSDGIFAEMFKDKMPQFSVSYYQLTFQNDKAIYKYDRMDERTKLPWGSNGVEDNFWFNDYGAKTFADQKNVFGDNYLLVDSLMEIEWKLVPNETREIIGFNCRKAVGKIFDSVYVFAFYTDEITTPGGPMGIHGLPGMIMGITIPRMFTSWVATKLQVDNLKLTSIAAPTKGKKKSATELQKQVVEATKDWGTWGQQSVWNLFL